MGKTKHQKFVEKMDGLFTSEIVEHIRKSRKEAKENFIKDNKNEKDVKSLISTKELLTRSED